MPLKIFTTEMKQDIQTMKYLEREAADALLIAERKRQDD